MQLEEMRRRALPAGTGLPGLSGRTLPGHAPGDPQQGGTGQYL